MKKMSIAEKIANLDSKYLWVLMIIVLIIPSTITIGIPIKTTESTITLYNKIESLKPGEIVLCEVSHSLQERMDTESGSTVIIKHLFSRGLKIVFYSLVPIGPSYYEVIMNNVNPEDTFGAKYGEDYVFLGYIAGEETAMVGIMNDIWGTVSKDFYNNRLEDLPLMENIHTVDDTDFLIALRVYMAQGDDAIRAYSITGGQKDDRAWATYTTGGLVPTLKPWVNSGHILVVIGGITHGAEYEKLSGFLGMGIRGTDVTSFIQMFMVIVIIVTNIAYIFEKLPKRKIEGDTRI